MEIIDIKKKKNQCVILFINGQTYQGDVDVEYCPTEEMWVNVLNRTKYGEKCRDFNDDIINLGIKYEDGIGKNNTSKCIKEVEVERDNI